MLRRAAWIVGFLFVLMTSVNAAAQPSAALMQKSSNSDELLASIDEKGGVRVIVEFEMDISEKDITPDQEVLKRVKENIKRKQDKIIARHFPDIDQVSVVRKFQRDLKRGSISPYFVINVTKLELDGLAADDEVVRVNKDTADRVQLVNTVSLVEMNYPDGGAYGKGATGAGQAIAILDTGVQADHPFISGKIIAEACFSTTSSLDNSQSLCRDGAPQDTTPGAGAPCTGFDACVHGTHVAGIAAGRNITPGTPVGSPNSGIARDAKIVSVKIFSIYNDPHSCGFGNPTPCILSNRSDQKAALDWLFENSQLPNAKVAAVNLSIGGGLFYGNCDNDQDMKAFKFSVDRLKSINIATIIAAGNDAATNAIAKPACVSSAIRVSSSTKDDKVSGFSNIGTMTDLLAPGGELTGGAQDVISSVPGGRYSYLAGTSMAAPHVAGAFAAIRTVYPFASVQKILDALTSSGLRIEDGRPNGSIAKPRIRVARALAALGPPVLMVNSSAGQQIFGISDSVFFPATFEYDLTSTGPLQFAIVSPPWIKASPSEGFVDPFSPAKIKFTILSGGLNGTVAKIVFRNMTSNDGTTTRDVSLKIFMEGEDKFHGLSPLPGLQTSAAAGAANEGGFIVGTSCQSEGTQCQAMFWYPFGYPVSAGSAPGYSYTRGVAVSDEGKVMVGIAVKGPSTRGSRLNCAGSENAAVQQGVLRSYSGLYALGCLPGDNWSEVGALSSNGRVIVGDSENINVPNNHRSMRWVDGTPYELPTLTESFKRAYAYGVNANGSVIVGCDLDQAVMWNINSENVATILPLGFVQPGDLISCARAVNSDGKIIVGYGRRAKDVGNNMAFRWEEGVMKSLGKLPGASESMAYAVSSNGKVVVGMSGVPFRWTPDGMRPISDLAAAAGFDLSHWQLTDVSSVSGDGSLIVGSGFYDYSGTGEKWVKTAWVLRLNHQ